jgi:hypothetical protein
MIVASSNDATHYVFNALTHTTDGPELDDAALKEWLVKRNVVNRYFASLGFDKINTNQKTWCEGPYGRERQSMGPNFENRNKLTTEAVARLLFEMVTARAVTPARCRAMMNLLHRDPSLTLTIRRRSLPASPCRRARSFTRKPAGLLRRATTPLTYACRTARSISSPSSPLTTARKSISFRSCHNWLPKHSRARRCRPISS